MEIKKRIECRKYLEDAVWYLDDVIKLVGGVDVHNEIYRNVYAAQCDIRIVLDHYLDKLDQNESDAVKKLIDG